VPIFVKVDDRSFDLDALPISAWERIEELGGLDGWGELNPFKRARHARACIAVVAELAGVVDVPALLATVTPANLMEFVSFDSGDQPKAYTDGSPQ